MPDNNKQPSSDKSPRFKGVDIEYIIKISTMVVALIGAVLTMWFSTVSQITSIVNEQTSKVLVLYSKDLNRRKMVLKDRFRDIERIPAQQRTPQQVDEMGNIEYEMTLIDDQLRELEDWEDAK